MTNNDNVVLWNNPTGDAVWRAWTMSRENAKNVQFALSFNPQGLKAYLVNDSYRMAVIEGGNPEIDDKYNQKDAAQKALFDLTDITESRFGKILINSFKDHEFGRNPVNYASIDFLV